MFSGKLVVKSEEKRLVFAEVYIPLAVDTDDETMTAESIEAMAHRFISSGRFKKIDILHNKKESGVVVVESSIVRHDSDPDGFMPGSWVLGLQFQHGEIWDEVKSGELNALSFSGAAAHTAVLTKVTQIKKVDGETEKSTAGLVPIHSHRMLIKFDDNSKIIPSYTREFLGHKHQVIKTCATASFLDHSHRIILISSKL